MTSLKNTDKPIVIYVGAFELPDKNAAAQRVLTNAKIFEKLGYEAVFLGVNKEYKGNSIARDSNCLGFDCWKVSYPSGIAQWLPRLVGVEDIKYLLEVVYPGRVALVINYNYPAIAQLRTKLLCDNLNINHVADITEWYDTSVGPFLWRIVKKVDTYLRMYLVNKCERGLITTSPFITDFYQSKNKELLELPTLFDCDTVPDIDYVASDKGTIKLVYVCSPLDPKMVKPDRSNLKERLDILLDNIIQINKLDICAYLDVYGNTQDEVCKAFPELEGVILQTDKIRFHGMTPNSVVRERIAKADCMIFLRDDNRVTQAGFPGKLAESISLGTPVITNSLHNLNGFKGRYCLFLVRRGEEIEMIRTVANYSVDEKTTLKKETKSSKLFHYDRYTNTTKFFLDSIVSNKGDDET
jgi:glycosyltransferase involved in cell wall biosynthesis